MKTWLVCGEAGFSTQSPICPNLACPPLNTEVPPFFRVVWPSMSGKVILLLVRAGAKQTSPCLWRLIINSSKAGPMAPTWVFNVTAQNGQGDQTLPAESRLPILPRVPPSWAWGSQDPWDPQHSLCGWTRSCASWGHLRVAWIAWLT